MFQTGKNYPFSTDTMHLKVTEYMISADDRLEMRIFTNDGFRLVDVSTNGNQNALSSMETVSYVVEKDGTVKLPLLGNVLVKGMQVKEAEKLLEKKYAEYYVTPFVLLKIINRHVLVFQGDGGTGAVVNLQSPNTTLIEAITMAGGVHSRGKAYKIKIIRGDLKNPEIFEVDLSTIEGMKKSNLIIQANDIIYVEPTPDYSSKVLAQITPVVGILTSFLLIFDILKR